MTKETSTPDLKDLPKDPGIYFHKNTGGDIIYIGKAANLRNRVRQYFQKSRARDPKTEALVAEIADVDWMVVDSELEALFLEAEMVRRYMPRYNILLRDDKSLVYIRIDYDSDFPTVSTTRRPMDDGARYFGPYLSALSVRQALKLLRRAFPFATRKVPGQKRATLHYHLGLDPGLEEGRTSLADYRANLRKLMAVIEGRRKVIERELEKDMKQFAKNLQFEEAEKRKRQLSTLRQLSQQVVFSDKEFLDISKDHALNELVDLLQLEAFPARMEGYDVSHQQGSDVVASMVVFTNGASNKAEYRKFKTKQNKNDDFYNVHETIRRRLSEKNVKKWGLPSLVLIDGGKGQLDAAVRARDEMGYQRIPFIGLAKREEQIILQKVKRKTQNGETAQDIEVKNHIPYSVFHISKPTLHKLGGFLQESENFITIDLPKNTNLVKLLQRIRDESHRFAVSYHSMLRSKHQTASLLDEIPGVGPSTRKKLLKAFGSLRAVREASAEQLAKVVGPQKAALIANYLGADDDDKTEII